MAYYFVSDVHAGLELNGVPTDSQERLIGWLDAVAPDAEAIFLLGDIFDFWFEYKRSHPSGFDRLLSRFAELTRQGVALHFFPGNHDMWTESYLSRECGIILHTEGYYTTLYGKNIYMEHGDLQSIGSRGERFMQFMFRSPSARKVARALVPYSKMMRWGSNWSRSNRAKHTESHRFKGEEEGVVRFAREYMRERAVDIFVFGHLHAPAVYPLSETATLYVLGDWIGDPAPAYGRLDAAGFSLLRYEK